MPDEPIEGPKDREIRVRRTWIGNISHQRIHVRDVGGSKPRGIDMCQDRRRMNKISIMIMMIVIICVSEIGARVGESGGGDKTFPGSVVAQRRLLLITRKQCNRSLEFGDTCCCEGGIFEDIICCKTDLSVLGESFAGKILTVEVTLRGHVLLDIGFGRSSDSVESGGGEGGEFGSSGEELDVVGE